MKKLSQSGATHTVLALTVALIVVVGVAGWRVYDLQKKNNDLKKNTSQSEVKNNDGKTEAVRSNIPDGYTEYKDTKNGFSFVYPKDWITVPPDTRYETRYLVTLVSPKQRAAYEDFVKSGRATEGPVDGDLYVSKWDSVNDELAGYGAGTGNYKNLAAALAEKDSVKQKIGELTISNTNAYELSIGGFGSSYGIVFERPNKNIFEFNFINIWEKADVDETTKTIVNSIRFF